MNLGEARSLVRLYINEPRAAHWTDAQLNTLIQLSNTEIYHQLVAQTPDLFTAFNQFLVPAGTWTMNFSAQAMFYSNALVQGPALLVLGVSTSNKQASLSGANCFGAPGCDFKPITPVTRMNDLLTHSVNADGYTAGVNNATPNSYRVINGTTIVFNPVPQQSFYLWMWFVPNVIVPTEDNSHLLLAGYSQGGGTNWNVPYVLSGTFDELVPLLAAIKAKISVGDQDDGLPALYRAKLDSMKNTLGLSLQRQTPQSIMGVQVGR